MKTTQFRVLVIAVIALAATAWVTFPQVRGALQAQQAQQRGGTVSNNQMWVYRVDPVPVGEETLSTYTNELNESIMKRNAAGLERLVNQRAAEGWELTGVGGFNLFFK